MQKEREKSVRETNATNLTLPSYNRKEELLNTISHIVGAVLGLAFLIILLIISVNNDNVMGVVSSIIYSITVMILYSCSAYYHGLHQVRPKKVFRVLDHCSIFLLIAGTYTVISLSGVAPVYPAIGWIMFGCVWGLSILGIVLNAISIEKFKIVSMILNIVIGWFCVVFAYYVIDAITLAGFLVILAGGICYTLGAILYGIGKKIQYFHSVFHFFVLAGTIVQFLGIAIYCI